MFEGENKGRDFYDQTGCFGDASFVLIVPFPLFSSTNSPLFEPASHLLWMTLLFVGTRNSGNMSLPSRRTKIDSSPPSLA